MCSDNLAVGVLEFVQRCQIAVGAFIACDRILQASSLWACLASVPPSDTPADRVVVSAAILRLAVGALREQGCVRGRGEPGFKHRGSSRSRVGDLLQLIRENYTEPDARLAGLAAKLGVSVSYLSRALARFTSHSFSTHLNGFRLLEAAVLLRASALSVKEISARVGYNRTSDFDRCFRRWCVMTPGEFRRAVLSRASMAAEDAQREIGEYLRACPSSRPSEIADSLELDFGLVLKIVMAGQARLR